METINRYISRNKNFEELIKKRVVDGLTIEYIRMDYHNNLVSDIEIEIYIDYKRVLYFAYYWEVHSIPEFEINHEYNIEKLEKYTGESLSIIKDILNPL